MGVSRLVRRMVSTAPTGSTTPERKPYKKERFLVMPLPTKGREMIAPSGKF